LLFTFGEHQQCGFLFKHFSKVDFKDIGSCLEVKKLVNRNKKILLTVGVVVALVLVVSLTFVNAATPDVNSIRTWNAKGYMLQKIDNETLKYYPASFSLQVTPTTTNGSAKLFDVTGGTVTLNGVVYTVTSGNGGVLPRQHAILLKATATNADGQTLDLKLAARYVWQWGNNFNVNIAAKATVADTPYELLMRTLIRPGATQAVATTPPTA
jgi:hypothetical protein